MVESDARRWNEWDRHGRKVEMALVLAADALRISAILQDQGVAYLEATLKGHVLEITDIFVQKEINYRAHGGFIGKTRVLSGRKSGYGSLLIRALVVLTRKRDQGDNRRGDGQA